jgi:phosphate transport system protein
MTGTSVEAATRSPRQRLKKPIARFASGRGANRRMIYRVFDVAVMAPSPCMQRSKRALFVIGWSRVKRRIINKLCESAKARQIMIISDHTTKVFDADLIKLTQKVAEMGGLAQKQIADAMNALARRDAGLAGRVVAADAAVDGYQREIEEKAVETIALRQPMAIDLRAIVAMLRIAGDLERIGDLAKNIGKRTIAMGGEQAQRTLMRGLQHMGTLVIVQLAAVLDSFVGCSPLKAIKVWQDDKEIDALYVSLFRELLTYTMEDPGSISNCVHLLFCAKNIERIGDHATNIAEAVYYMVAGHAIAGERPKGDTSSYMIETIAMPSKISA